MSQDLSYEAPEMIFLITIRTISSRMWFLKNKRLTNGILAFLAKYQEKYGMNIYAFCLMGNHYHLVAGFPKGNKSRFLCAFNAIIPKLTNSNVSAFEDGKLWARRARPQALPTPTDIEKYFFYTCLNPTYAGVVKNIRNYDNYSSFFDSIHGVERKFNLTNWEQYRSRKRFNKRVKKKDFTKTYTLKFSKLPQYKEMDQKEYADMMLKKLHNKTKEIIKEREEEGKGFIKNSVLCKLKPGAKPRNTKTSERNTKRPLFLTSCPVTLKACIRWYFEMLDAYKKASKKYLAGELDVEFPPGTYKPVVPAAGIAQVA